MNSTPNPQPSEPPQPTEPDVLVAQVARESKPDRDAARHASAVQGQRPSRGGPALRGLIGLLLAACIFGAAFVSHSSYGGDAAKLIIARWAPQLIPTPSGSPEKPGLPAQPSPPTVQRTAAEAVLPQATPPVQTTPQDVRPTAAPVASELTQLLQTMARDLANMQQGIEQLKADQEKMASDNAKAVDELKAGQEKMASDNAKAVDELKVGQEQMTQLIAKVSEQNPKPSAPPPRPVASPTRRPVPTHPSP